MKKVQVAVLSFKILLGTFFIIAGGSAFAQEVVSVMPGKTIEREFYLYDVFDSETFSPAQGYLVFSLGIAVPAGDLSISVSADPEREFTARMSYSMLGAGFSINEGFAVISASGADPGTKASATVPINSTFGIYALMIKIDSIKGEVKLPVPFTITFSVTEAEPAEEEPAEES